MTLHEMLKAPETKKMFRELMLKYHPDPAHRKGDVRTAQKISQAKQSGDEAMRKLHKELMGKKPTYSDLKDNDLSKYNEWAKWIQEILNKSKSYKEFLNSIHMKHYLFAKKSGNNIDVTVQVNFLDDQIRNFTIFKAQKYKTKRSLMKAVVNGIMNNF